MNPRRKALRLHQQIFRSLQSEVRGLIGDPPPSIRRYQREFEADFRPALSARAIPRALSKERLIEEIRASDVSFIADFHTFGQAQRTALRLMRDSVHRGETWLIGLELIPSQFQPALESFQAGRISLEDFHHLIHYRDEWGFPWKNYAPIFDWAREAGVGLLALNRPKELVYLRRPRDAASHGHTDLHERDQWAAGIITDRFAEARAQGKRLRVIALYGELHVGAKHLPAQLATISRAYLGRRLRSLIVHQNHDRLYWRLAGHGEEMRKDILRLGDGAVCVFSGTPWAKLQSLASWAEGGDPQAGDAFSEDTAFTTDYLSLMRTYGETVARFLDLGAPSFDSLNVVTADEPDFVDSLDPKLLSSAERRVVAFHVRHGFRLYVPRARIAYLGAASQNAAAELASIHLLRSLTGSQAFAIDTLEDFHRAMLEAAFGFFGSLLLNPRRKCDQPGDHRRRLRELDHGGRPLFALEREIRALAIAALSPSPRSTALARSIGQARLAPAVHAAARFAGQALAKRLHQGVLHGSVTLSEVRRLLVSRLGPRESYGGRRSELVTLLRGHGHLRSKRATL